MGVNTTIQWTDATWNPSLDNEEVIASITPSTNIRASGVIDELTTLYGRILRVGGRTPRVMIETMSGVPVYCDVSQEIAQQLGSYLYEFVELSGVASWNPIGWQIETFRINSFVSSDPSTIEKGMIELRNLVGRFFEDIEDVEAYVSSLRSEDESQNSGHVLKQEFII